MGGPKDGGPAFATGDHINGGQEGMSLRDWFAGQALSNPHICTGDACQWDYRKWFGERGGVTKWEICAAQAYEYADAMLRARDQ